LDKCIPLRSTHLLVAASLFLLSIRRRGIVFSLHRRVKFDPSLRCIPVSTVSSISVFLHQVYICSLSFMDKCIPSRSSHLLAAASLFLLSIRRRGIVFSLHRNGKFAHAWFFMLALSYLPRLIKPHPLFIIPIPFTVAVLPLIGLVAITTLTFSW